MEASHVAFAHRRFIISGNCCVMCVVIGSKGVWSNSHGSAAASNYRTKVDFNETLSDDTKGTVNSTPRARGALRDAGWRFHNSATK
jgi:hypothetical protein